MKLVCVLSFLLILSFLSSCASQPNAFDHSWLALTWPPSLCELDSCAKTPIETFTIHGLWPADVFGNTLYVPVQNCSDSLSWMDNTTAALVQELDIYWPNFKFAENKALWKHEWRSHGCMQGVFQPEEYFQKALSIRKMAGSIESVLASLDVVPSNRTYYNVTYFAEALKQVTGMDRVAFTCVQRRLLQVKICVNRNADQFINCNEGEMSTSCDPRTLVMLPPKPASRNGGGIIKALHKTSDVSMYAGI